MQYDFSLLLEALCPAVKLHGLDEANFRVYLSLFLRIYVGIYEASYSFNCAIHVLSLLGNF